MTKKQKPRRHFTIGKILVAAVLVCMLAITASAAEDVLHWFTKFFGGPEALSQEQIQYLQENIQETAADLSGDTKEETNCVHTDVLQFVDEMLLCKADANNTHITKQGEADNRDIKVYSLTLSEKGAQLEYYYTWEEIPSRPCSISGLTVVFGSGDTRFLPITDSQRRMYFDTEERTVQYGLIQHKRNRDKGGESHASLREFIFCVSGRAHCPPGPFRPWDRACWRVQAVGEPSDQMF